MFSTSHLEISRSAYKANISYLKTIIGPGVKFSSVIKGNAYGHGIENIVPLAESTGINHFSVFSANEALEALKVKSTDSRIMIMGFLDDEEMQWAIENQVEFFVFDKGRLEKAVEEAQKVHTKALIHIEVETGFHRTGFEFEKMEALMKYLKMNQEHFVLEGVCTHFAGAESITNYYRIKNQISEYRKFIRYFKKSGMPPRFRHTASSAAALTYPDTIMDMVRIGIAQYGFWPSPETQMYRFKSNPTEISPLKRLISWKTKVMAVKEVDAGNFVGYGTSYLSNKKIKIAIVPVGYANGFSRALSNMGRVLIGGRRVPVIGMVTMNTMTVNVTDVPGVKKGDEVVIVGKQKRLTISIASFGEMSNLLNYQLVTRLPADIPRIMVK